MTVRQRLPADMRRKQKTPRRIEREPSVVSGNRLDDHAFRRLPRLHRVQDLREPHSRPLLRRVPSTGAVDSRHYIRVTQQVVVAYDELPLRDSKDG